MAGRRQKREISPNWPTNPKGRSRNPKQPEVQSPDLKLNKKGLEQQGMDKNVSITYTWRCDKEQREHMDLNTQGGGWR